MDIHVYLHEGHKPEKEVLRMLMNLTNQGARIMGRLEDVEAAIVAEKKEIHVQLDALKDEIKALKDQLASGERVTAEDLDRLKKSVEDISEPLPPVEQPPVEPPVEPFPS